jgi:hypothetical protein
MMSRGSMAAGYVHFSLYSFRDGPETHGILLFILIIRSLFMLHFFSS